MQHVDPFLKLGDINYPPLTQHMQANLVSPRPDVEHRLEIRRHLAALHGMKLETRCPPRLGRKILHVVEAGTNET
jgi:hypothetical protein